MQYTWTDDSQHSSNNYEVNLRRYGSQNAPSVDSPALASQRAAAATR